MSEEGPDWFAPKRYGFGSGMPISWQGWAITIGFIAIAFATAISFVTKPIMMFAILVPATATLVVIAAKTTRGGWRWRWGDRD
jgi:hypothetical protein